MLLIPSPPPQANNSLGTPKLVAPIPGITTVPHIPPSQPPAPKGLAGNNETQSVSTSVLPHSTLNSPDVLPAHLLSPLYTAAKPQFPHFIVTLRCAVNPDDSADVPISVLVAPDMRVQYPGG